MITKPAEKAVCTRCGCRVIAATVDGLLTVTDIEPLTRDQEMAALLNGRATFDLQPIGKRVYVEWRDVIRIRFGRSCPVVAEHGCPPGTRIELLPAAPEEELPDDPPF